MPEIVCIACPIGCRMEVKGEGIEISVSGNRCPKGDTYGREELLAPRRVVTGVVRTGSAVYPFAPVRTDAPLPRGLMADLMAALAAGGTRLPVRRGAELMHDFAGSGVNVVFTRSLPPDEVPPVS
jgi:CxxC motif-containing protein